MKEKKLIYLFVSLMIFFCMPIFINASIPAEINKSLALANSMLIGWNDDQIFIDLSTYEYIELDSITTANFPLWILNLNVATNKFMQSMRIRNSMKLMYTSEAQKVYELTDAYLERILNCVIK